MEAAGRKGITPDAAKTLVRTNTTVIGALAVARGDADALDLRARRAGSSRASSTSGTSSASRPASREMAALSLVITSKGAYFLADTHVQPDPERGGDRRHDDRLRRAMSRRFGLAPKIALLSHADFGSADTRSAMQDARGARRSSASGRRNSKSTARCRPIRRLSEMIRERVYPASRLKGEANVLIMPNLDAANIAFQFTKILADALPVGPILIGPAKPAHILTPSVTARGIVNMTAVAVVEAQEVGAG